MRAQLAVAAGAALGAPARYALDAGVRRWFGSRLPWGTLAVNLLGCAAAGLAAGAALDGAVRWLVSVGFLSSFTTASTLALELTQQPGRRAVLLLALHLVPGLALAGLGVAVGRSL